MDLTKLEKSTPLTIIPTPFQHIKQKSAQLHCSCMSHLQPQSCMKPLYGSRGLTVHPYAIDFIEFSQSVLLDSDRAPYDSIKSAYSSAAQSRRSATCLRKASAHTALLFA